MLAVFLCLTIIFAIVFGAFRILLGWFVPAPAVKRFDTAVNATCIFIFKLFIVVLAGFIVYAIWAGSH